MPGHLAMCSKGLFRRAILRNIFMFTRMRYEASAHSPLTARGGACPEQGLPARAHMDHHGAPSAGHFAP